MKKGLYLFLIVCLLALELPARAFAAETFPPGRTVNLLPDGVGVTWQTPPLQTRLLPDGTSVLSMDGFGSIQTPGQANLPEDSLLVALPPGASPSLEVQMAQVNQAGAPESIARVSGRVVVEDNQGEQVFDLARQAAPDSAAVTLEEIGVMRGVRLARLTFRPVRLAGHQLEIIGQARATIRFGVNGAAAGPAADLLARDAPLSALAAQVLNPAQLVRSAPQNPTGQGLVNRTGQAAIEVSAPGLTAITYSALSNAGFLANAVDPQTLHLEINGVEVPTEWVGDNDAFFEAGEQLLFYAQPRFSRWTARDVYFLSAGSAPRLEMTTRDVTPTASPALPLWMEQLFEQNLLYTPDCYCAPLPAGRDGDRWVWDALHKPDRISATYPANLTDADPTTPAEITLWMIGYTDVELTSHTVQVKLNETSLGSLVFAGKQAYQATLTIPAGVLLPGGNTLQLTLADSGGLVDGVWLDAFSIRYARDASVVTGQLAASGASSANQYALVVPTTLDLCAYDITNAQNPVRLLNVVSDATNLMLVDPTDSLPRRYAVVPGGTLKFPDLVRMAVPLQPVQGADYLMITAPEFAADLAQLTSLRQSKGLGVVVEDVRAIYDAVDGRPLPDSIRVYLAHAYATWTPRPQFVLLVGDGTTDPRRYRPGSSATFIPPYLVDVDPFVGEIAADNRYVMVDGSDTLPDMWIGRLPVNSHVEAAITVTKIVQYELNPVLGSWNRQMLIISDKNDPAVGDFTTETETLAAAYVNSRYTLTQMKYEALPSQPEFHQNVIAGWNQGKGVILYNGHGSQHQWGADVLFHLNDLPVLLNGNRLPVLLEMTCLTGAFQIPNVPTLDETLLRRSGKGVVAAWGSTGLGLSAGHMLLARGFLDEVMANSKISIGNAAALAKLKLVTTAPALEYLVDIFTLLGDPAMRINFLYDSYLPAIRSVNP